MLNDNERLKDLSMRIIHGALERVDPQRLFMENVKLNGNDLVVQGARYGLLDYHNVHVLGAGKGVTFLFHALDELIGKRIQGGIIVSSADHSFDHERVSFYPGAHPIPDERSLSAGKAMAQYIRKFVGENDLVIFLLTGGASSMMVLPVPGLGLEDIIHTNKLLLRSGADIREINSVRKALSSIKGGKMSEMIFPGRVVTLAISDIVGSPRKDIGSGPTIMDLRKGHDALEVLDCYSLVERLRPAVGTLLESSSMQIGDPLVTGKGLAGEESDDDYFILADNTLLLSAIKDLAREEGVEAWVVDTQDHGDVRVAAKRYGELVREVAEGCGTYESPVLLIAGGELTVNVTGTGKGGRNQEFILSLLSELRGMEKPYFILSMGSDGIDGPTAAAGAWIDEGSFRKAEEMGLDPDEYLRNNDSNSFFMEMDQLILTGPTHTNLMDLRMFFLEDFISK